MLPRDIIFEISKYAHRIALLNLLSTCKLYKSFDDIYFDKYALNLKCKINKLNGKKYHQIANIITKCTKVIYNIKDNSCSGGFLNADKTSWLSFGDKFNDELVNLPRNIKILKLGNKFNKSFDNINNIVYSNSFYRGDQLKLHRSHRNHISFYNLHTLVLGKRFNQPIDGLLPPTLKRLFLGRDFDQSVDNLPNGLEVLHLGKNFNHPVDKLPSGLLELVVGESFNQSIDNLPDSIIILKKNNKSYRNTYNYPINKLPLNLEEFCWNFISYVQQGSYVLPKKIRKLQLTDINDDKLLEWIGDISRFELLHINMSKFYNGRFISNKLYYCSKIQKIINIGYNWHKLLAYNCDLFTKIKHLTYSHNGYDPNFQLNSNELNSFTELETLHTDTIENIDEVPQYIKYLIVSNINNLTKYGFFDNMYTNHYDIIAKIPVELKTLTILGPYNLEYFAQLDKLTINLNNPYKNELKEKYKDKLAVVSYYNFFDL
ncbi:FNIP repeat protein [Klosneuvirus KNV1]|uniref:FNIP repeat protein n=1 Tax=Klosneuvirus KNV1 TaxID=1977640 RepID=A0A1V0SL46_9VIRU|nr:FNIP repeat protein [Klosneuvirus KNV1]